MRPNFSLKPDVEDYTGILNLEIEKDTRGKSVVSGIYHQGGIKVQRPIYLDSGNRPCFYMLNPHGGMANMDYYKINLKLYEDAELTLTTQGATVVYKCPDGEVRQEIKVNLSKNSYFEYLPGPTIGYENSKLHQNFEVHMDESATLMYLDVITSGWSPKGITFTFDYLRFISKIYMNDQIVVYDHVKLEPAEQELNVLGYLEGYSHLGTFMVINNKVDDALIRELYTFLKAKEYDFKFGISRLSVPGFSIRFLANMTQHIEWIAMECRTFLNQKWYGKDVGSLRKY